MSNPKFALIVIWIVSGTCGLRAQTAITEYSVPTTASRPTGIVTGPDGNLWFAESDANKIATITVNGTVTEFAIPTPNSQPGTITAGPDGNLWFTEISGNKIGEITTNGLIAEYPLTGMSFPGLPATLSSIAAGPDGNLWFPQPIYGRIGRITTSGVVSQYRIPAGLSFPADITAGPNEDLWFTQQTQVGRISTAGAITEYPLVVGATVNNLNLRAIAKGPDGNLWLTAGNLIWRISPSGAVTSFPASADGAIAVGADGNLWFADGTSNKIGRITTAGTITEYSIPTSRSQVGNISPGPDGNIWFTEPAGNKVAKLILATVPVENLLKISASTLTFTSPAPPNLAAPAQSLTVTTSPSSVYTVSAGTVISPSWLTISPSGNLTGIQTLTVSLNPKQFNFGTFGAYTGYVTFVSGHVTQSVPVTLNITRPVGPQVITAVVNAGSFIGGAIVPGEIVSIFGTSLGPANPLGLALNASGQVSNLLGGVSVSFNGYLAPLIYVSSTLINCVVPYEIAGSAATTPEVFYLDQTSPAFSLSVANTKPAVFTLDGSGTGLAAAINGSGGINGPANPGSPGSVITLYVTGEGQTAPPGKTGGVTTVSTSKSGPLTPQPQASLNVTIGNKPAAIAFYGEAPGLVAGVMQINAQIPDGLAPGNQPVVVSVGDSSSQSGVTVSVQ